MTIGPPLVLEAVAADNDSLENDAEERDGDEAPPPFGEGPEVRYTGKDHWTMNGESTAETGEQEMAGVRQARHQAN